MSLFRYKDIEMDVNNEFWSDKEAKDLADKLISLFKEIKIVELYLEDDEYGQLFVEDPHDDTDIIKAMNELAKQDIGSSFSDWDYGEVEAINLYFKMDLS